MFSRWKRRFTSPTPPPSPEPPRTPDPLACGEEEAAPALAGAAESEPQASGRAAGQARKFTPEERADILTRFRASGQSATAFAYEVGIAYSTLTHWLRKERHKPTPLFAKRFTPDERRAAVEAFLKSNRNRVDFAKLWGCSPSSIDKWVKRYRDDGPKGLETRVRKRGTASRPHPKRLPDSARDLIVQVHSEHKDFGMKRLADHLARFHGLKISPSGARKILLERGVQMLPAPHKRPRPKSKPPRRFERARPGQMWQSDITSFVLRRHNRRVYLTVFLDDHSRYVVAWRLSSRQTAPLVIDTLLDGIARFGKPEEVLTDQGRQYFAWRGKSAFQKLLAKEGVRHVVSRTHHPQTLGKCERLWKTVGDEFWDRAAPADLDDARERLGHWFRHYNHFRTHQGIDGLVPADRFFGAETAVRESLEAEQSQNELRLALDEAPRRSVYLVGQIGSQRISLHGERGKLLVDTPDGGQRELEMNDLGIERTENRDEHDTERDDRGSTGNAGNTSERGNAEDAPQACGAQTDGLQEGTEGSVAGEGSLGERTAGGEGAGAPGMHGDPGVLAGEEEQGAGGAGAWSDGAARLAAESEGAVGDDGGALDATASESGARSLRGTEGGVADDAQGAHRRAGDDAFADRRHRACLANSPVGEPEYGVSFEGRKEPCQEEQAQAANEESRSRAANRIGSEPSSAAARTRRRKWLRWLRG